MSVAVAHELLGPVDGPPVVLSCSLGTDRSMWDPQTPALVGRNRVVRYDLRGHGSSPAPPSPYAISDLGEDMLALMDRLGIERASLCGVSIGAMTSIWVAAHAPERVQRLVLCCTSARFAPEAAEVYRSRAKTVREQTVDAVADGALERWFTPAFRMAQPELMAKIRMGLTDTSSEGYAGCCEALAALDLHPVLGSISAPTLVIAGAEDPATPPDHGRAIADGIAGARFELIEGAAHLANIEKAELVTPLIAGFIDAGIGETVSDSEAYETGMKTRREVLGDAHVDRAGAAAGEFGAPFQEFITRYAWGAVWSRPGIDRRMRSAITLTALVSLRAENELGMHVRAALGNGLTADEIREVILHTAVYAGVPAANSAFAVAQRVLTEEGAI